MSSNATLEKVLPIILATESIYKKQVFNKLALPYRSIAADIDERPLPGETCQELVNRLAVEKAQKIAKTYSDSFVVAADQVASFQGDIIGKSHNKINAVKQLRRFSGNRVTFIIGIALYNPLLEKTYSHIEYFDVYFADLSPEQIERYIDVEQPFDCAGSFKSEGLGILLFEKLHGRDPNALIGLPLIALNNLFHQAGVNLLDHVQANCKSPQIQTQNSTKIVK